MGPVLAREWQRFRHTPRLWLLVIVAPVLLPMILLTLFADRTPSALPVAVLDYDNSSLSRQIIRALDAAPGIQVDRHVANLKAAGSAVRRGEVYAVVALPPDLHRLVLRGEAPRVQLYDNRQMLTAGNVILREVRTAVATVGAGIGLRQGVFPPVRTENHPLFNPGLDFGRFLALPLMVTVLHILVVVVTIDVTGRELREGTAGDWLQKAGDRPVLALLGKLAPYFLWFSLFGVLALVIGARWLGLEVHGSGALWLGGWVALTAACMGLGLFLTGLIGNLRMATSVASVIVSPAFAYSGMTFPAQAMEGFAVLWSRLLPLGHYLNLQAGQLVMGAPANSGLIHLLWLLPFVVLPLLVLTRWRRLLSEPALWGAR
ncbi:MAG: ABC transporter permease [Wenzhouxiangella sp.]|jgi:ABC-2 type transport system permease protein|nr:ABC transporter permease [Wenzhouxiangella sp.]